VHQLTKLGDQLGLGVLILPDDLRVFSAGGVRTPNARVAGRGATSNEPAGKSSALSSRCVCAWSCLSATTIWQ